MYAPDSDSIIRWHGCTAKRTPQQVSYVYLIHFSHPIGNLTNPRGQARHYLGSSCHLEGRLACHKHGNGAALMTAVSQAGIAWEVARLWPCESPMAARQLEFHLKRKKAGPHLCPICQHQPLDGDVLLRAGHYPFHLFIQSGKRQPTTREPAPCFARRSL